MSLAVVIICAGCSIPVTPKPKLNHTSLKKFPLEVAVILSNEFRNCTFETTDVDVEGTVIIKIGQASYQAFHDNLNILFKKVDFYDTDSMPKKSIPYIWFQNLLVVMQVEAGIQVGAGRFTQISHTV